MAGKTKGQKKKRAKLLKQTDDERRYSLNQGKKKILADQEGDVLGNNAEPVSTKDAMAKAADIGLKRIEEMEIEEPFDPQSLVANILKNREK